MRVKAPVTLTVAADGSIFLGKTAVTLQSLAGSLRPLLQGTDATVIVAADDAAPHGVVTRAMLRAREGGAEHFSIAVKRGG
jgi:biopolymer transport protein ExbD